RNQWPLLALCWGCLQWINCAHLCRTEFSPGTAFFVFSLVIIPTLVFMGLITFERVLQSGSTDIIYARGVNRIRHLYLEYAPQLQSYFILSAHDDRGETMSHEEMSTSWVQVFFNAAGMIAVINSVLIGSFVGLLFAVFGL